MRILGVTLRWPPYVAGGYELLTRDALEALAARGHAVEVLCGRGERLAGAPGLHPLLCPSLDGEDPWQRALAAGTLERARRHLFDPANHRATLRAVRAARPDVALCFNLGLVSLAPLLALRHAGVPGVCYVADPWPENHWLAAWRADSRAAREKAGRLAVLEAFWRVLRELVELGPLLASSEALRARLVASGIAAETVEVLPTGLPPDAARLAHALGREPAPRAGGEPLRVVCASSLWEGKGQHVLVEALALARAAGAPVELDLAGGGRAEYAEALARRAAELGLGAAVRFHGRLPRERLAELLAAAHVMALPSIWEEPFGLVTLEGMAFGLVPVVSDAGASPELVRDGVDGRVVRAGDAAAWARALAELARADERRVALARAARAGVRERFDHARFVDALEAELLGRARRDP